MEKLHTHSLFTLKIFGATLWNLTCGLMTEGKIQQVYITNSKNNFVGSLAPHFQTSCLRFKTKVDDALMFFAFRLWVPQIHNLCNTC